MKKSAIERRSIEFRALDAETIEGALITYGERARIMDFEETFKAGCFGDSINNDLICSIFHQRERPIARTGAGLELKDSPLELRAKVSLSGDMQFSRECAAMVKGKILQGFSIEFRAVKDDWQGGLRIISEAIVSGLSVVPKPAYAGSTIDEIRQNFGGDDSRKVGKIFQPLWKFI